MLKLRSVTAGALAAAMLATSVTPAMAQRYPGGPYGYGRPGVGPGYGNGWRRRDRIDAGDVIAGVAIVGIIAAIAAAASSSSRNRTTNDPNTSTARGSIGTEDAAADACADAAEQRAGRDARVTSVDTVNRAGDGYSVRGMIAMNGYRDSNDRRSFTCSARYGNVDRVDIGSVTARGY